MTIIEQSSTFIADIAHSESQLHTPSLFWPHGVVSGANKKLNVNTDKEQKSKRRTNKFEALKFILWASTASLL
jgi:hypothetical protein